MDLNTLSGLIFENGIVGAGGAGFPTHMKLSDKTEVVILNSCECEPLLKVDKQLLSIYTEHILKAMTLIVDTVGAKDGIVALKNTYKEAIAALEAIIERFPKLSIKIMEDVYPAGDEVVLVYEITGKIVPEGGIPIDVNAVVLNTETALNIYNAIFLNKPVTDTFVTITGAVNKPLTVKVPLGTSVAKLLSYAGGPAIEKHKIIMGGPMTGRIVEKDMVVGKTTKAIIVLPEEHYLILKKQANTAISMKRAMAVCSQCQACTDLCPRSLLGHSIKPHRVMNALANKLNTDIDAFTSAMICSECGLCEMYSCYQGLSPRTLIGELKSMLRKSGVKNPHRKHPDCAHIMREDRKVPKERLIARLGLSEYNVDAPMDVKDFEVYKVEISLSQHIGVPAVPVVKAGDKVVKGQLIADVEAGKLGAKIHASISGEVSAVNGNSIVIGLKEDFHG
jgi:Na+-translocating ferredoxin:NAD+ oxidoreductase RnfC subunit